MALPPLKVSDYFVSVSNDLTSISRRHAPFQCTAYDDSCVDWGGLCDHLRHVLWVNTLSDTEAKFR